MVLSRQREGDRVETIFGRHSVDGIFIAASIAVPIAIAQAFELNQVQSAELIQSTFFSLGLVAMVQCLCGHMLPINESPAGLWWGYIPFMQA